MDTLLRPRLGRALSGLLAGILCFVPGPVTAQRAPVLSQVTVPHPYYWRNLYVPQVTTGPHAVAWLDDATLVYAMNGTLWKQVLGQTEAVQLTDGPGYDHQPDVSPDGKWLVFTRYQRDAYELQLLEVATGVIRPLTSGGAVNLEPRWSPDGKRLAWMSTQQAGRFHLFVADVTNGALTDARRISADTASPLARTYYGAIDHAISPSWSPDGRELLYVTNTGHMWGSGGVWRAVVPAAGGTLAGRELRDEETTWGARPDWSPDGRRVVYASYIGRTWHQLFLMTADGKNPYQLTFGDYDATNPRWSPDGQRIAYLANETGMPEIRVIHVRSGTTLTVSRTRRVYKRPLGRLSIRLMDDHNQPMTARVSVTGPDGRAWVSDGAWRQADDSYDRKARAFEVHYFHAGGATELMVPEGAYTVEAYHGLEWKPVKQVVQVKIGDSTSGKLVARFARIADLALQGWRSADLHVHMNYGGPYKATPATVTAQARAEDVRLVEALIVNKESRIPDLTWFNGGKESSTEPKEVLLAFDEEFHTPYWGHSALLGLTTGLVLPPYASYQGTAASSLLPMNSDVFALARKQGAITGYVHPYDEPIDPFDEKTALSHALPIDAALGQLSYMEILGFAEHWSTARTWYRLLNAGFRIPAGAGTDAMTNYASLRGPIGLNRTYVKSANTRAAMLAGIAAGRTMATNGPLVELWVNEREPGDSVMLPASGGSVRVRARLRSMVAVDHLELVANGVVVANLSASGPRTSHDTTFSVMVSESKWFVLGARGDSARAEVLDMYPFGTTSPVYVTVGGRRVRVEEDVKFVVKWLERLEAGARGWKGFDTEGEREWVVGRVREARVRVP